jgi:hypothetical protein
MKANYNGIVELATELDRQDATKNDFTPLTSQMEMEYDGQSLTIDQVGSYKMSPLFHGQVADRLNIPKKYYDMIGDVPGLRASNVNTLFNHKPQRRMVRTLDGNARAFLSDRYRPIDHLFVMTPFMEALSDYKRNKGGEFSIRSTALTEKRMYVEIMFPNISGEVVSTGRGREKVNAGIALTNSEVGLGAFDVRSFIWWQWCSNGAIAESYIRKYHTGRRVGNNEEDYNIYSDKTIQKEMDAFQSRIGDIFQHALTDDAFQDVIDKIQLSTEDKVEKPNTLIRNVTKRFQLTDEQGERILSNMVEEGNMNRYGLANGVTRLAQEVDDADAGYDLEKLGNDIITLKASEWQVLSSEVA